MLADQLVLSLGLQRDAERGEGTILMECGRPSGSAEMLVAVDYWMRLLGPLLYEARVLRQH